MGRFIRNAVLVVWAWLMLTGVCLGKQVYLRDGGSVACESVWQRGNLIVVKINRDTLVEFERSEVDLRRTFHAGGKKKHRASRNKPAGAVRSHGVAKPASVAVAGPAATPPAVATVAAATPVQQPVPVAKPLPVPVPVAAVKEEAQPEPAAKASSEPATPPDKADAEKVRKQAAEMMAEAIRNKDSEMMKRAMELQRSAIPQNDAQVSGMSIKILLMILVISLLIVISMWVVFEKGGESGWKSLVPIYNMYILMEIAGKPGWWFLLLIIPFVDVVFYLLAMLALAERFGRGALFGIGLTFLPMFFFPLLAFGGSQAEA